VTYVIAEQRDGHVVAAFAVYREYLEAKKSRFPVSVFALASSEWYFDFTDRRCPHDSWLDAVRVEEPSAGQRRELRSLTMTILLLGAYHDGYIELVYPDVYSYDLAGMHVGRGHGDLQYDEFRVSEQGRVIHESRRALIAICFEPCSQSQGRKRPLPNRSRQGLLIR
jgi:hypothetical protein